MQNIETTSVTINKSWTKWGLCDPSKLLTLQCMMIHNGGIQQQVLQRPKAELVFRPWWDFVEDCVLSTMLAIGEIIINWSSVAPSLSSIWPKSHLIDCYAFDSSKDYRPSHQSIKESLNSAQGTCYLKDQSFFVKENISTFYWRLKLK